MNIIVKRGGRTVMLVMPDNVEFARVHRYLRVTLSALDEAMRMERVGRVQLNIGTERVVSEPASPSADEDCGCGNTSPGLEPTTRWPFDPVPAKS